MSTYTRQHSLDRLAGFVAGLLVVLVVLTSLGIGAHHIATQFLAALSGN